MIRLTGRLIKWFSIIFAASALIIMFTPLANRMASCLVVREDLRRSDIIVILGGGAYRNGVLGKASEERLIRGLILYKDGYAPRLLFSGGPVLRPSEKILHTLFGAPAEGGASAVEAKLMEEISLKLGVPEKDLLIDAGSVNTYENLRETRKRMDDNGLKTCLIVTSPTHMLRAALIAKKLGMTFYPAPVSDYSQYRTSASERLSLFREVVWEYLGLLLYKTYGYI